MVDAPVNLSPSDLPTKQAHRFGLHSAFKATMISGPERFAGGLVWQDTCGLSVLVAPDNCDPALLPEDKQKVAFGPETEAQFAGFALYALSECNLIGSTQAQRDAWAMDELHLGEWFAIEKAVATKLTADTGARVGGAGGVAGAVNALGVALMEWGLPVEPVVHMTPNVALALGDRIVNKVSHLELRTGERVVVGYGYGEVGLADPTDGWIFLTGPGFVQHGTAAAHEAPTPLLNLGRSLAERQYAVGITCKAIWIKVNDVITNTA